jgi:hypothetical protein
MSYVYVVHEAVHSNGERTIDLTPALEFGHLRYLLPPTRLPSNPQAIVETIRSNLAEFTADDYLLLTGSPVAIGVAVALAAARVGGRLKMLRWQRSLKSYEYLTVDLRELQAVD